MCELHGPFVRGHQPRLNQLVEEVIHSGCRSDPAASSQRHATPGVLGSVARLGQPKEHALEEALFGLDGALEELLGGSGDGSVHAAGFSIPVQRQGPPVPAAHVSMRA